MPEYQTHYPDFDVLRQEEHWDPHTREIVTKRVKTELFLPYRFLTQQEGETLFRLCSFLLGDDRHPVISYVVHHFDSVLQAGIGESQRKIGVPRMTVLLRDGLAWFDRFCGERYGGEFLNLKETDQQLAFGQLMQDNVFMQSGNQIIPVKEWIDKILEQAVAAYYSHPAVWSEIGYAGPAYPRGYVRSEMGLTDPWEARRNGQ
ncbi:gluconate 2-dehydrogenase subunit 3 family protein [Cohnella sp. CFH 77786]|uniref:gluconate 2-dehydrogenase subunit 3 family protein n=1 Tax=Cohnella sp. CFH 77786 TaxID=2662265 RepID=UPI001C60C63B|nr:gluconate 2-dehydrogenase subunit 3 family protein [Cohnella sp. CFH 77786]MBW5446432.1 gluconate 2-dehydrogenase subunit 3 family protein [Cohnella sp. CFH 77786]